MFFPARWPWIIPRALLVHLPFSLSRSSNIYKRYPTLLIPSNSVSLDVISRKFNSVDFMEQSIIYKSIINLHVSFAPYRQNGCPFKLAYRLSQARNIVFELKVGGGQSHKKILISKTRIRLLFKILISGGGWRWGGGCYISLKFHCLFPYFQFNVSMVTEKRGANSILLKSLYVNVRKIYDITVVESIG